MESRIINPWTWQDDLGYAQAIEVTGAERTVYCAGIAAIDAEGKPAHPGDMTAQISLSLDNLEAVLAKAGLGLSDVVRLNYYTTDVERLFEADEVTVPRLEKAGCRPASTLLGVANLAFPELLVEIEATAAA